MNWVNRFRRTKDGNTDKRKVLRTPGGGLVAHYWNGGAPAPRKICNMSADGAYIQAPDHWPVGTVITLLLQPGANPATVPDERPANGQDPACVVHAAVVHSSPQGFGVQFMFSNHREKAGLQQFFNHAPRQADQPEEKAAQQA